MTFESTFQAAIWRADPKTPRILTWHCGACSPISSATADPELVYGEGCMPGLIQRSDQPSVKSFGPA